MIKKEDRMKRKRFTEEQIKRKRNRQFQNKLKSYKKHLNKDINRIRNKNIQLIRIGNRKINVVRIGSNESLKHFLKKCEICYDLNKNKRKFITEARFKDNSGYADIIDLDLGEIWEVLYSEEIKDFKENKLKKYPKELYIRFVKV